MLTAIVRPTAAKGGGGEREAEHGDGGRNRGAARRLQRPDRVARVHHHHRLAASEDRADLERRKRRA